MKHQLRIILSERCRTHAHFNSCHASAQTFTYLMMERILAVGRTHNRCDSRANRMRRFTTDQVNDLVVELDVKHLAPQAVLHCVLIAGVQIVVTTGYCAIWKKIKRYRIGFITVEGLPDCL